VRSVVGLLPLCASTVYDPNIGERLPGFASKAQWFTENHPQLLANMRRPGKPGAKGRHMLALLDDDRLRRVLRIMLDENEFLSDYGIRSISRAHHDQPYSFWASGQEFRVAYAPAESTSGLFGGNSNWRGPIWVPVNILLLRALFQLYTYYGDEFLIECPTGSGQMMNLFQASQEVSR